MDAVVDAESQGEALCATNVRWALKSRMARKNERLNGAA